MENDGMKKKEGGEDTDAMKRIKEKSFSELFLLYCNPTLVTFIECQANNVSVFEQVRKQWSDLHTFHYDGFLLTGIRIATNQQPIIQTLPSCIFKDVLDNGRA